jgi:hypothetical protein
MFTLGLEEVQFRKFYAVLPDVLRTTSQTNPVHFRVQLKLVGISMNLPESWGGEGFYDL